VLAHVNERVAVLGEDEQPAATVRQLVELGNRQALLQRVELGVLRLLAYTRGLRHELAQRGDLDAELVQLQGDRGFVQQLVARLVVEIVFVLLEIDDPPLELSQALRALSRAEPIELFEEVLQPLEPSKQRLVNRARRARESPLEHRARESDAVLLLPGGLRKELVDVRGDGLVEAVLLVVQAKRNRVRVPVGEEAPSGEVPQILLEAPKCPGAFRPELQDVPPNPTSRVAELVRLRKHIRIDEPHEVSEPVIVSVVRSRGEQHEMVTHRGEPLGELVAPSLPDLVLSTARPLGVRAALVSLVDDHEVPSLLPDPLANVVLLGVVQGGDDLRLALPEVEELLLVVARVDDLEALAEEADQLVLPLNRERRWDKDEHALDRLAELQLLDEEAGHDRLSGPRVVCEQEPQPRLREHPHVDRLDLVRQRADARQAHCELAVVRVGQPDARRLDEQTQLLGVDRGRCGLHHRRGEEAAYFVSAENRLIQLAVRQADADLGAVAERTGRLHHHLVHEVAGQTKATPHEGGHAGVITHAGPRACPHRRSWSRGRFRRHPPEPMHPPRRL